MHEKVIIIGGGVAGLTAAHELIERDFEVHVFERRSVYGGKAASSRSPMTGATAGPGAPGEHGFRFFPGWYRHLTNTLQRIPYRGRRQYYDGATVFENLVPVRANTMAWSYRDPIRLPLGRPQTFHDATGIAQAMKDLGSLGLTPQEIGLFFLKLAKVAMMTDETRAATLGDVTWWDYLECGPGKSAAYCDLADAVTRTSIAAKATEVTAYTIARLAIRTLLDSFSTIDRVLNGPTSETWIDPWIEHLTARGVVFHTGYELTGIVFDGGQPRINSVELEPMFVSNGRRLRNSLGKLVDQAAALGPAPGGGGAARMALADELELALALLQSLREELASPERPGRAAVLPGTRPPDGLTDASAIEALLKEAKEAVAAGSPVKDILTPRNEAVQATVRDCIALERNEMARLAVHPIGVADYFVFALPLEQLAYYVSRSPTMTTLDPSLRRVVSLSGHMDWMAGIQFYLSSPFDFVPGHIVCVDSEWSLTALEQTHLWRDVRLPEKMRGVISVDISSWDRLGRRVRKEAFNCTPDEIAIEVWEQLKAAVNKQAQAQVLRDDMLFGYDASSAQPALQQGLNFHLDEAIANVRDRTKQGLYEKARALQFSVTNRTELGEASAGYMWGQGLLFNIEPLLINRAGTLPLRPDTRTAIGNMFLAGDFVHTETDLACMEGANEAARAAVNGILDAVGSTAPRCQMWPFSISREVLDVLLPSAGLAGASSALDATRQKAGALKERFWRTMVLGLTAAQGGSSAAIEFYDERRKR